MLDDFDDESVFFVLRTAEDLPLTTLDLFEYWVGAITIGPFAVRDPVQP